MLYVGNVLLQFFILNVFLGPQYTFWGVGILSDIWNGREWSESGHFPRVTMCDFNVNLLIFINFLFLGTCSWQYSSLVGTMRFNDVFFKFNFF